jgi:hypothetical protein
VTLCAVNLVGRSRETLEKILRLNVRGVGERLEKNSISCKETENLGNRDGATARIIPGKETLQGRK